MPVAWVRCAVVAMTAVLTACAGTSRVGDQLTTTSLGEAKKAVALIKLGAADPACTVLSAGIGVREGESYRLVQTARIVRKADEAAVAELELSTGEYHVVSYSCARKGGAVLLAHPAGGGIYKRSYASFTLQPGEILNVGYLQLVPLGSSQAGFSRVVPVHLAVTDWPLAEIERFKQQRPGLYGHMKTRLMAVHREAPLTPQQIQARCAEMKKLQADGKLQNLPTICTPSSGSPSPPGAARPGGGKPGVAKKEIGA